MRRKKIAKRETVEKELELQKNNIELKEEEKSAETKTLKEQLEKN